MQEQRCPPAVAAVSVQFTPAVSLQFLPALVPVADAVQPKASVLPAARAAAELEHAQGKGKSGAGYWLLLKVSSNINLGGAGLNSGRIL
jgi:hypothetical protein